jgi:hypothetical protein
MAALRRYRLTLLFFTLALPLPAQQSEESARLAVEASETRAERHCREITQESSAELFNMGLGDSEVSLFINGYWKASLSLNWGFSSSPLGVSPKSSDSPFLFTQESDLTLSLWLRERWFLEASFLDDYDLNTYRAGYQGLDGESIQYVGVGNTGLDFPVFPYLDLGGDSKSSFGAYGRFGSDTTQFHAMVRYDAAAREERTFVGDRERSFSTVTPDHPVRGKSFVLPDENIAGEVIVYFEDSSGPFNGGGKRWRLARPSEYAASAREGILELVRQAPGMVAVYYQGGTYPYLGIYNSSATPAVPSDTFLPASASGFLGDVQIHFDNTGTGRNLKGYPQPGGTPGAPAQITLNGQNALVIYEPGTFSPFERQSRYQAPSDSTTDAVLIRQSNGDRIAGYELLSINGLGISLDISIYSLSGDATNRGLYELFQNGMTGRRSPETMWPLADMIPEIYFPGKSGFSEDVLIRFTNYGPAGTYNIGTDVVPGSVQVYRGGIIDTQMNFDPVSGTVTLASPVGFNEVIRVTYLRRSEDRRLGSLAAGVGFTHFDAEKPFSWEAALGLRWNISKEAYTENGVTSPGTVGFGGKMAWDYETVKTSVSLGLGYEQPDTTGLYRVAGMEGNSEIVLGVSTSSGFISEAPVNSVPGGIPAPVPVLPPLAYPFTSPLTYSNRHGLIYRNYRKVDLFGTSSMESIDSSAPVISNLEGPYPARDGDIDLFAAEFENMNSGDWTGFEIPLGRDGALLEGAKALIVPYRIYAASGNIQVIVQAGSLAAKDSAAAENPDLIVEQEIYRGSLPTGWISNGTAILRLTADFRRKLQNANHLRVIIISGSPSLSGRVLVAKPYVMGTSWRAVTIDPAGGIRAADDSTGADMAAVAEVRSDLYNSRIGKLHDGGSNFVLQTEWGGNRSNAGADGRTPPVPLSTYRKLSFYVKGGNPAEPRPGFPAGSTFHFMVSRGPDSWNNPDRTALRVDIPNADLLLNGGWHLVEIRYSGEHRVSVDGNEVPGAALHYNSRALRVADSGDEDFAASGQSGYIAALFDGGAPAGGTFYIDEICLEDPAPAYRVNTGTTLEWTHADPLLTVGDTDLVSNVVFNTALETAMRGDPANSDAENFSGFQSRSSTAFTLLDTKLTGRFSLTHSNEISYWNAGHSLARDFGPLSITESFNSAPQSKTTNHDVSFGLSTFLHAKGSSKMSFEYERLKRNWAGLVGITPELNGHPGFTLEGSVDYIEKTDEMEEWLPSYGETWVKSFRPLIFDSGTGFGNGLIQNRDAFGRGLFSINRTPLGADLSFEGASSVSLPLETTRSRSTARIDFPFLLSWTRGVLRTERTFRRSVFLAGTDLGADITEWKNSVEAAGPLWAQVPVYALYNSNLDDAMDKTLSRYDRNESTRFNEILSLSLLFPERYNLSSLVVPVSFLGQIDRTMEQRLDTRLDVLSYSTSLGFSAINLFGSMGSRPVFSFYQNDEIRHSLSYALSLPKGEDPVWRFQAEQSLGFFGFKGAELTAVNTFTASLPGYSDGVTIYWSIPRDKTLLGTLYENGMNRLAGRNYLPAINELAASDHEKLIRESLSFSVENYDHAKTYSVVLGHESIVRIMGKLTLTGFANLYFDHNSITNETGIQLSFGTTFMVTF